MKRRPVIVGLALVLWWSSALAAASPRPSTASVQSLLTQSLQHLQDQQWTAALSSLRQAYAAPLRQHLDPAWRQRLPFLLGYLYFQTGDDGKAVLHLEQARDTLPALGDYTLWYLGQALLRLNRLRSARTPLERLLEAFPDSVHRREALFAAAEVNRHLGEWARATRFYGQYQRDYPDGPRRGQALLGLGLTYRDSGNPEAALRAWRSLWVESPEDPAAEIVPDLERTLPSTFPVPVVSVADLYGRAARLFRVHRHAEAVKAFELARMAAPDLLPAPETVYQIGMAQYHARQNAAAMETLQRLYDRAPQSALAPSVLFSLGRLALRMGHDESFQELSRRLLARFPTSKEAQEVGYLLGHFHRNRGRTTEAAQAFQHVIERGTQSEFADAAWWYLGWLQYGTGDYEQATQTWGRLLQAFPTSGVVSDTLYWQGRALEHAGRAQDARARFERLQTAYPQTYYGHLGTARLTGRAPWPWHATWGQTPQDGPRMANASSELSLTVGTNPHARRGRELWAMRLFAQAGEEFQAVPATEAAGVRCQYYAALAYHWAGEHHRAMALLRRYGKALPFKDVDLSKAALREITYPLGGLQRVEATAFDGIDPLFVGALIMAESAWNPQAFSRVGARGLMQLMPDTGRRLAQSMGTILTSDDQLFDPQLNLKLGIAYLRQLLQQFEGRLPLVMASYNAGEEEVGKWWAKRGHADLEEFIADIPFRETRRYVQRVLVYYAEYQRIYRGR